MPQGDTAAGGLSRRHIAKGVAWSAPVIYFGSAAPAMAVSPAIILRHLTVWRWFSNNFAYCGGQVRRDGLTIDTTTAGAGVTFNDTRTTTSITAVSASFYFARPNIVWTALPGNSGCWTVPTLTGASAGGLTEYRMSYTCPIVPVNNGTTELQDYAWRSQCYDEDDASWQTARSTRRVARATVNGTPQTTDTGIITINS